MTGSIKTPDQRLRVFVSSTLDELAEERKAVRTAVEDLRMTPVMFELGARPHPPRDIYRAYLGQSDVFIGIYWQSYGWQAPGEAISGIEDELNLSGGRPRLIYVKHPAPDRHERLDGMLDDLRRDGSVSYKKFSTPAELRDLVLDDLALLISERFSLGTTSGPSLPGGTVTFFSSDLEDLSPRPVAAGSSNGDQFVDRHLALLRAMTTENGGTEVWAVGDSYFAVFPSARGAAEAAAAAQRAVVGEGWPADMAARLRIGLHTGEARLSNGSYVGHDVVRVARLVAAAHGGQTLLSGPTAEMVRPSLPTGMSLTDLGLHRLGGGSHPERVYQLNIPGVDADFTPIRSSAERRLPAPLSSFVGRELDLRTIQHLLLDGPTRLITITGPGGIGKTRLAIEAARLVECDFAGGVLFVDLSSVVDEGLVLPALGRALGVLDVEGRELADAIAAFVGDAHILVVIDNMEQVIATGADLIALLEMTTKLTLLVTSREPLRVRGEREHPLRPLPVPNDDMAVEALEAVPSLDLFVQRARAVVPDFELNEANAHSLIELVRRLDGLPLAIELAAPGLRFLTPADLLNRLGTGLGAVTGASRDMPDRHHDMRSAITWSYELLSEQEQTLFRRLGVFAGGWTVQAAEEVCAEADSLDGVLDLLTDLVTKSMVTFYLDSNGQPRYGLLETIRQFAVDESARRGEAESGSDAHLNWCLRLVRAHETAFVNSDFPSALNTLEEERHNLRLGLEWALSSECRIEAGLEIAGLLWSYWDVRGYVTEGVSWLERLLEAPGADAPTSSRALALDARGWLGRLHTETSTSETVFAEAEQLWRAVGDTRRLAWSISMHAMITFNAFQYDRARQQFEEGIRLARQAGDEQLLEIWCNYGLAHVHWLQGELNETRERLERSLVFARKWGHTWAIGHAQFSLGLFEMMMDDVPGARARLVESLILRVDIRDLRGTADCLGSIALLHATEGDCVSAAMLLGAAEAQRQAAGYALVPWQRSFIEQATQRCRESLGPRLFDQTRDEGARLNRAQAIQLALADDVHAVRALSAEPTVETDTVSAIPRVDLLQTTDNRATS